MQGANLYFFSWKKLEQWLRSVGCCMQFGAVPLPVVCRTKAGVTNNMEIYWVVTLWDYVGKFCQFHYIVSDRAAESGGHGGHVRLRPKLMGANKSGRNWLSSQMKHFKCQIWLNQHIVGLYLSIFRWVSARKAYLQCVSNGDLPFLH